MFCNNPLLHCKGETAKDGQQRRDKSETWTCTICGQENPTDEDIYAKAVEPTEKNLVMTQLQIKKTEV